MCISVWLVTLRMLLMLYVESSLPIMPSTPCNAVPPTHLKTNYSANFAKAATRIGVLNLFAGFGRVDNVAIDHFGFFTGTGTIARL